MDPDGMVALLNYRVCPSPCSPVNALLTMSYRRMASPVSLLIYPFWILIIQFPFHSLLYILERRTEGSEALIYIYIYYCSANVYLYGMGVCVHRVFIQIMSEDSSRSEGTNSHVPVPA